ncbi:hypothetical protein AB1462_20830 [Pseudomonas sp. SB113]|uniref:hypothetical protein n=1 Tax=Pseudomonas sp. SB113 TaxID=3154123 RepID=UPI00345DB7CD
MSQTTEQAREHRFIINHRVAFGHDGDRYGWTGGGSIIDDDVSGRTAWFVQKASRAFTETLPPHSNLTVILYCRVRLPGSTLKATHSGGTYYSTSEMVTTQMSTYWVRNAKADAAGKFWIDFETDNGQSLRIHQIEVMGPVTATDTPESLGMEILGEVVS